MTVCCHPMYRISDHGRIFSRKRNRVLKPYSTPKGYLHIDLDNFSYSVHRLVMKHFKKREDMCDLQVNHIDGDKKNNKLSNLEWCTNQENSDHSWENGREAVRGSRQGSSKLTEKEAIAIKKFLLDGKLSQKEIAEKYNVSRSTIGKIKSGDNWSWLKIDTQNI